MNDLEIRGLRGIIKEEVEEMIDEKIEELREELNLTDADEQEGDDESGEESLPPSEQEQEEEEPEEEEVPEVIVSGQQVSRGQMKTLNKPKQKIEEDEDEKWDADEFQE